jgi:glutathione S-transferase
MITVHHLNNSRSQRVLWLLEELEVPYSIKRYERDKETLLAPAELRAVHPLGKSPVITDGDVTVAESGAIIEYLVDKYGNGRLKPLPNTPEYLRYIYWLHYAEGSAMTPLFLKLVFGKIENGPLPFFIRPIAKAISKKIHQLLINPQIKSNMDFMESELTRNTWFAGSQFTAADIQMSFPVEGLEARAGLSASHPKLVEFLKRIHERPAYQNAIERGGPYTLSAF